MSKTFTKVVKTQLEPSEAVKCYMANRYCGVDQDTLAMLFDVNPGRVSEACIAIEWAAQNVKEVYEHAKKHGA
jgi:hypothetical protein